MSRRRRPLQGPAVAFGLLGSLFFACGGRTDIDLEEEDPSIVTGGAAGKSGGSGKAGASAGASGASAGGTPEGGFGGSGKAGNGTSGGGGSKAGTGGKSGKSGSGTGTGGKDLFDSGFPIPDSGPIGECTGCLEDKCKNQINACYNNPDCLSGIQCIITQCVAGGGMGQGGMGQGQGGMNGGTQCLLMCFNGDLNAGLAAFGAFQCISQQCGMDCIPQGGQGQGGSNPFGGNTGQGGMGTPPMGGPGAGGMTGGGQPMGGPGGPGGEPMSQEIMIEGIRIPLPEEVPGYPELQDALRRP